MSEELPAQPVLKAKTDKAKAAAKLLEENLDLKARLEQKANQILEQTKENESLSNRLNSVMESVAMPSKPSYKPYLLAIPLAFFGFIGGYAIKKQPPAPLNLEKISTLEDTVKALNEKLIASEEKLTTTLAREKTSIEKSSTLEKSLEEQKAYLSNLEKELTQAKSIALAAPAPAPPIAPVLTAPLPPLPQSPKPEKPQSLDPSKNVRIICNTRVNYVNLREGPDADEFHSISQLDNHSKVEILDDHRNQFNGRLWHRVQLVGNRRVWGYVDGRFLKLSCEK